MQLLPSCRHIKITNQIRSEEHLEFFRKCLLLYHITVIIFDPQKLYLDSMRKLKNDSFLEKSYQGLHGCITRAVENEALSFLILRPQDNHKNAGQSSLPAAYFSNTHTKIGMIQKNEQNPDQNDAHVYEFSISSDMNIQGTTFLLMTFYLLMKLWIHMFIAFFFIPMVYECCIIYNSKTVPVII